MSGFDDSVSKLRKKEKTSVAIHSCATCNKTLYYVTMDGGLVCADCRKRVAHCIVTVIDKKNIH